MAKKMCINGHTFEKTSSCPICPVCSSQAMEEKFGTEFPKLGAPALRALERIGVSSLSDLTKFTEKDLLALHGFGPRALGILRSELEENGLSFARNK